MIENDHILMSCPACGYIAEIPTAKTRYCVRCRLQDIHHRMMTVPELLLFARRAYGTDRERAGDVASGAAINLVRYSTILECMRAAGDAHAEASYAGVDAHGAYHRAMDALQELLEAMQDDKSS